MNSLAYQPPEWTGFHRYGSFLKWERIKFIDSGSVAVYGVSGVWQDNAKTHICCFGQAWQELSFGWAGTRFGPAHL